MSPSFLALCLHLLGITPDHWEMIKQKPGGRRALFQLLFALIASIALGCAVFRFGITFMHWSPVLCLLLGLSATLMLLAFDLHMFDQLRTVVDTAQRAIVLNHAMWARAGVMAISVLGALVMGVDHQSDSITSHQKQEAQSLRTELITDPRYAHRLKQAANERKTALEQIGQIQQIENDLASKRVDIIQSNRRLQDELKGAETPEGVRLKEGRGKRAKGFENQLAALSGEIGALEGRKAALGDPQKALQAADQTIADVHREIDGEIKVKQGGSTQLMEAFFALAYQHPVSTLLPFLFMMAILLLADGLLLAAYASAMHLSANERAVAQAIDRDWSAQITAQNARIRNQRGEQLEEMQVRYTPSPARATVVNINPTSSTGSHNQTQAQPDAQAQAKAYDEAA